MDDDIGPPTVKKQKTEIMGNKMAKPVLEQRYIHAMVLSGVGDALGYKNGEWEFCHSGTAIYEELQAMGGLGRIVVKLPKWMVSDDTVMHLATGEALAQSSMTNDREKIFLAIAAAYKECIHDMAGRAPGLTCMNGVYELKPLRPKGYQIPFNPRGGGCGAAMRSMCIGLRYPKVEQLEDLIAVSVESGRMTHHHPVGYLGSLAGALFTAYAIQGKSPRSWGCGLLKTLPLALKYVESTGHCVEENKKAWDYFETAWKNYLESRNLTSGESDPAFPDPYGFKERDAFVKKVSFSGWGGASGHDAPMIAYDAFLGAGRDWEQLCYRSMFHAGDSDSTGVMAACWFGATYGVAGVPESNYKHLEYRNRLEVVGSKLYALAFPEAGSDTDRGCGSQKNQPESQGNQTKPEQKPTDQGSQGNQTKPEQKPTDQGSQGKQTKPEQKPTDQGSQGNQTKPEQKPTDQESQGNQTKPEQKPTDQGSQGKQENSTKVKSQWPEKTSNDNVQRKMKVTSDMNAEQASSQRHG